MDLSFVLLVLYAYPYNLKTNKYFYCLDEQRRYAFFKEWKIMDMSH